jgi:hypothetical protein
MSRKPSRRQFLTATGSIAGTSLLAGCTSVIPGVGDSTVGHRDWVPAPEFESRIRGSYAAFEVETVQSRASDTDAFSFDWFEDEIVNRLPERESESLDYATKVLDTRSDPAWIIEGSFEDYETALEDANYERLDTVNDVAFYERGYYTVAVSGSNLLLGRSRAFVERCLRAKTGDVPTSLDANEHFDRLTNALDAGDYVYVYTYPESDGRNPVGLAHFEGQVGAGSTLTLTDDGYDATLAFVFADATAADLDAVETYVTDESFQTRNEHKLLSDRSFSKTDRVVTVTGTGDLENL